MVGNVIDIRQFCRENGLVLHASYFSKGFARLHVCTAEYFLLFFLVPILSINTISLRSDKLILLQCNDLPIHIVVLY